jgi:hypothetical protein
MMYWQATLTSDQLQQVEAHPQVGTVPIRRIMNVVTMIFTNETR